MKNVIIEVNYPIELVEFYHSLLCQISIIITAELFGMKSEFALQISFKAINDLVKPNGLILTLLVFGTYSCLTNKYALSPSINQYSIAIRKAMEEVRRSHESCQVNKTLNTLNGLLLA